MTVQKINEILATKEKSMLNDALIDLENQIRMGETHFYIYNKKLVVSEWYDCFIFYQYNKESGKYEIYYNIEGKTESGKYFNIKSTDYISRFIEIK